MAEGSEILQQIKALEEQLQGLKRSMMSARPRHASLEFPLPALVLEVSGLLLALPVDQVIKVIQMVWITSLPGQDNVLRGTVGFRGRLVPVVDLHIALRGRPAELDPDLLLIVVRSGRRTYALIAERVDDVVVFQQDDLVQERLSPTLPDFVRCLLRIEDRSVSLIEPADLLKAAELEILEDLLPELEQEGS